MISEFTRLPESKREFSISSPHHQDENILAKSFVDNEISKYVQHDITSSYEFICAGIL